MNAKGEINRLVKMAVSYSTDGSWFTLSPGETISLVSKQRGIPVKDIISANGGLADTKYQIGKRYLLRKPALSASTSSKPVRAMPAGSSASRVGNGNAETFRFDDSAVKANQDHLYRFGTLYTCKVPGCKGRFPKMNPRVSPGEQRLWVNKEFKNWLEDHERSTPGHKNYKTTWDQGHPDYYTSRGMKVPESIQQKYKTKGIK